MIIQKIMLRGEISENQKNKDLIYDMDAVIQVLFIS